VVVGGWVGGGGGVGGWSCVVQPGVPCDYQNSPMTAGPGYTPTALAHPQVAGRWARRLSARGTVAPRGAGPRPPCLDAPAAVIVGSLCLAIFIFTLQFNEAQFAVTPKA
jgi:hypothetical protein